MFREILLAGALALGLLAGDVSAFSSLDTDRSSATNLWRKEMDRNLRKVSQRPNLENYKPKPGMFPSSPDMGVNNTPVFAVRKIRNPANINYRIGDRVSGLGLGFDNGNIYNRHSNMLTSPQTKSARQAVEDFLRDK